MPRDKFISDNLINHRDYLREKCANIAQEQVSSDNQSAVQNEIHLNLKTASPVGNSGFSRSSEREYNEFAGHLQHDLAAVGAELANTEIKQKELDNFNVQLQEIVRKLQELPIQNSQDFFREFDRLKIQYFQSSGRVSAFRSTAQKTVQQPAQATVTSSPERSKRDILLPVSIIISALLISLTLLIVF